jgi:hypothetical protein
VTAPATYSAPMVIEQTSRAEGGYDIFLLLLNNGVLFPGTSMRAEAAVHDRPDMAPTGGNGTAQ